MLLFNRLPRSHRIGLVITVALLSLANFLQVPIIVEGLRRIFGGTGPVMDVLTVVFYIVTALLSVVVSAFVVGIFYVVLRSFWKIGLFFHGASQKSKEEDQAPESTE